MKHHFVLGSCVTFLIAFSTVVACATNDDASATNADAGEQTIQAPDAGAIEPSADADVDAACGDGGCEVPVDCTTVDFCSVTFPVNRLTALNAVWGSGPTDVWAAGARGTILHGDGSAFSVVVGSATNVFVSIWGTGPGDVWALDETSPLHSSGFVDGGATFERREGATWLASKANTGRLWTGLSLNATEVWLGGEPTTRFGATSSAWLLESSSDAEQWQAVDACNGGNDCTPKIRSMWAVDSSTLFAVGLAGQAYRLVQGDDGVSSWVLQNTHTSNGLERVWASGADDVWAVGEDGTILHGSASSSTWTASASPTKANLHSVWGVGPKDVWAAGDGVLLHFDGEAWTMASVGWPAGEPPARLYGIWGSGPDDIWIVGQGVILHRTVASRRHP